MAPAVLRTILDYPDKDRHAITTKPRFTVAGAPPPAAFIERLEEELGWEFLQIYGLTETAPLLTVSQPDHETQRTDYARRARAGVPAVGVDIVLRDEQGWPVPKDGVTVGEVCARSNVVFKGYWKQPEETAKAIQDGYFHTGDLAVCDAFGNIHIVDRKKDVIISGGENISSPDIEDALYRHPAVVECAVIGVPHEKWGETPKALVVLREGEGSDRSKNHRLLPRASGALQMPDLGGVSRGAAAHRHGQAAEVQAARALLGRRASGRLSGSVRRTATAGRLERVRSSIDLPRARARPKTRATNPARASESPGSPPSRSPDADRVLPRCRAIRRC